MDTLVRVLGDPKCDNDAINQVIFRPRFGTTAFDEHGVLGKIGLSERQADFCGKHVRGLLQFYDDVTEISLE